MMRPITSSLSAAGCCAALLITSCGDDRNESVTVISDLSQPRGLSVDGSSLCVAEAGAVEPSQSVAEPRAQVEAQTGRVVCTGLDGGERTVPIDRLPFVYYPDAAVTSGAADVIRADGHLYALIGESFGPHARSIVVHGPSGPQQLVDLLEFSETSAGVNAGTRSNPYSFVLSRDGSGFYVTEAARGIVLRAGLDGSVERFAQVPGHEVLTGMAWGPDGDLYVASFGQLPHPTGSGAVLAIDASGTHRGVVEGLTMVIDVGFDRSGAMFILEYATPPEEPLGVDAYRDGTGRLSYLSAAALSTSLALEPIVVVDGLDRPTAIEIADSSVYVSLSAGEQAPGAGSVVRFDLDDLLRSEQPAISAGNQTIPANST